MLLANLKWKQKYFFVLLVCLAWTEKAKPWINKSACRGRVQMITLNKVSCCSHSSSSSGYRSLDASQRRPSRFLNEQDYSHWTCNLSWLSEYSHVVRNRGVGWGAWVFQLFVSYLNIQSRESKIWLFFLASATDYDETNVSAIYLFANVFVPGYNLYRLEARLFLSMPVVFFKDLYFYILF